MATQNTMQIRGFTLHSWAIPASRSHGILPRDPGINPCQRWLSKSPLTSEWCMVAWLICHNRCLDNCYIWMTPSLKRCLVGAQQFHVPCKYQAGSQSGQSCGCWRELSGGRECLCPSPHQLCAPAEIPSCGLCSCSSPCTCHHHSCLQLLGQGPSPSALCSAAV